MMYGSGLSPSTGYCSLRVLRYTVFFITSASHYLAHYLASLETIAPLRLLDVGCRGYMLLIILMDFVTSRAQAPSACYFLRDKALVLKSNCMSGNSGPFAHASSDSGILSFCCADLLLLLFVFF